MAIRLSEVFVEVGARLSKFNRGMAKADKGIKKFGKNVGTLARQNSVAFAAMSAAGVLAFRDLILVAGEFDSSMRRVRAVSGATDDQFATLTKTAKKLGRTTQFTASQAAEGMEFLAKAGFEANEVISAIPGTLELAAAAAIDLGSAADIVTNVLTGFNLEVKDLARVNDILVKTFISSNTDLRQLGQAMKFVGPVAAGFGQDIEDVVAILGAMGNAGIQASMAGTSLRGALTRLASPSNEAAEILKELGINVFDSSGKMNNFIDIIGDLEKSGISATQVMEIFGQRAGPAMLALLSEGAVGIRAFSDTLRDSAGTAARIAKVQMEGFTGALKEFQSALEGLKIAIAGSGLLEFSASLLRLLADMLRVLASLPNEVLAFGAAIAGLVTIGAGLLAFLGFALTGLAAIKLAFVGTAVSATVATTSIAAAEAALFGASAAATTATVSFAALAGPLAIVGATVVALTISFFKLRRSIEEMDVANKNWLSSQRSVTDRMKEGFAVSRKFEGITRSNVRAMGSQIAVVGELTRGIRGLNVALSQAKDKDSKKRLRARITALKELRDAAKANIEVEKADAVKNTAFKIGLADFEAKQKAAIAEAATNRLIEQALIERVNTAATDAERRIAIENLAVFRKQKELEVFTFTQRLALQTSSLLKSQFGSLVVDLVKGQKTFAEVSKRLLSTVTDFLLRSLAEETAARAVAAIKRIGMARAEASANAVAAEAQKGILGIATATIAIAAFSALIGKFAKFHQGGLVPGTGNQEVLARLLPGERVLSRTQAAKGGGNVNIVKIFNPIVDSEERLQDLTDQVSEILLDRVMIQSQPA